ncbi:amidohydrolase [Scopulibacillus darangshiensis]|uniref:Amidohydrolase n=1 Tax=Scopulibacillus darangshiensis TaxID=442528 RepID=A0A4R2P933_9BACL|nr:amidohydrolase [Scopulibacillus darangshiensis]TCP30848.1 amidohydrolase [Scopulibacillus darangshiensis]
MIDNLFTRLEAIYPKMVAFRRDLHMYPEISFQEVNTPRKIADFLTALGIEVKEGVGGRGIVGILKGGKPGKTVALRADFDALPIQDEKNVDYKSQVPGAMHACGHDIHTAALLGVAEVLSGVRDQLQGTIVFIHQFAEELSPGGAKAMIEDGCLDGVDVIYGAHVMSVDPFGTVSVREGYASSAQDDFQIEIIGKGGHGSQPHLTVDPLVVGSQLVLNLQHIVSRRVDPLKSAAVTVGSFISGETTNVIPDSATIKGTVRTFDDDVRDLIEEELKRITTATCDGAGATARIDYVRDAPSMWNDPEEAARVEEMAALVFGEDQVIQMEPMMGSEDFAYYQRAVRGAYFMVGGGNPELDAVYPHHHPKFDVDERSMLMISKTFIATVLNYLFDGNVSPELVETP